MHSQYRYIFSEQMYVRAMPTDVDPHLGIVFENWLGSHPFVFSSVLPVVYPFSNIV